MTTTSNDRPLPIKVFRRYTDPTKDDGLGLTSFSDEVFGFTGTYYRGTITGQQPFRFKLSQLQGSTDPAIQQLRDMEHKQWDPTFQPPAGTPGWPPQTLATAIDGIFAGQT